MIVTGALGILGRSHCWALAREGANLIISDFNAQECDAFALEIESATEIKTMSYGVDLASESSILEWANDITLNSESVDVLVNNAAAKPPGFFEKLEDYSVETWRSVMAVNLDAAFLTIREIGKLMLKQGYGNIVNVSSIYGVVGPDQRIYEGAVYNEVGGAINTPLSYSASKGALVSITKHIATSWGHKNIRCNCLTPGGVSSGQNTVFNKNYSNRVPLNRMASAEDISGALVFLCSSESAYINGHNLIVDGGLTAW